MNTMKTEHDILEEMELAILRERCDVLDQIRSAIWSTDGPDSDLSWMEVYEGLRYNFVMLDKLATFSSYIRNRKARVELDMLTPFEVEFLYSAAGGESSPDAAEDKYMTLEYTYLCEIPEDRRMRYLEIIDSASESGLLTAEGEKVLGHLKEKIIRGLK